MCSTHSVGNKINTFATKKSHAHMHRWKEERAHTGWKKLTGKARHMGRFVRRAVVGHSIKVSAGQLNGNKTRINLNLPLFLVTTLIRRCLHTATCCDRRLSVCNHTSCWEEISFQLIPRSFSSQSLCWLTDDDKRNKTHDSPPRPRLAQQLLPPGPCCRPERNKECIVMYNNV